MIDTADAVAHRMPHVTEEIQKRCHMSLTR